MRKGIKLLAIVAIVLGAVLATFLFSRGRGEPAADARQSPASSAAMARGGPAAPIEADGYVVAPTRVKVTIPATGTLVANETVNIVGEVSRRLVKVHVKEGAIVKKNDLLFKLDDADTVAQLDRLRVRRANQSTIEARQKKLLDTGLLSQQDYDQVASELQLIDADISVLSVALSKAQIRAPFAGTVGLRRVSEGAWISPETPITTLQDTTRIKVDFSLPERYGPSVKVGQAVTFQVAGRDARYEASIVALEPIIEAATRSLRVRAVTDNPRGELVPGGFASVEVPLSEIEGGVMIPSQAVIPSLAGHGVFVDKGGVAELREVEIGVRTETQVQIVKGLAMGDTILLTNLLRARPGVPVKVKRVESDKPASPAPASSAPASPAPASPAPASTGKER